ncbi:Gfo/Idh/MocA family protein [Thermogutta terrifontis]|jgi:predicted dehydrogenase|uniref:Gfo/Idh/MocA family protein n=1 Tax=Thermogutta terrifontis TaxID=1331910 RepID=UPI000BA8CDFD|nr:Gfo/Idh/MocA family oxidoreductase [Thermogutta terrifontis]
MQQPRISRRRALQSLVATSLAIPSCVKATALGLEGATPASERVTVGHIGVGGRGRDLLRGFMTCPGAQPVAVADAYRDRREAMAEMIEGKAYGDFRELLAREDIDAVVIATPDHWHVPIAIMAAKAGKHAYVEKPLGLTVEQDLLCRKVFRETGRVFQYGTQQRSMAHGRFGCELVRSGKIGELKRIEVIAPDGGAGGSTEPAPVPPELDYEMWIGPAPMKPYTVSRCNPPGTYWIYDFSIGFLAGWGAHPLDIMIWGCDADLAGPMTFEGTGEIPKEGLYDTVIHWDVTVQMGNGVVMTFKPGSDSTKFIGTEGWVDVRRAGIDAEPKSLLKLELGPNDVHLTRSPRHDQNFIEAIKSGGKAIAPIDEAVRSDIISHMCDIAIRTGRKITWDPKKEEIVGDPEAAKMLSRPMRPPWKLEV